MLLTRLSTSTDSIWEPVPPSNVVESDINSVLSNTESSIMGKVERDGMVDHFMWTKNMTCRFRVCSFPIYPLLPASTGAIEPSPHLYVNC
jgi:hypothetical protein